MAKLTASAARALFAVDHESECAAKAIEVLIADFQATEKDLAAKAAGPLPGRYAVGEKVFFAADNEPLPAATRSRTVRPAGEGAAMAASVVGKAWTSDPGNKDNVATPHRAQPRAAAAAAGGAGEKVYYTDGKAGPTATSSPAASRAR